jgi:hypothetical protein
MTTITINGNSYNLVTMPSSPGFTDIAVDMIDTVATVVSPFVPSQVQTQQWPGGDSWTAQVTLPPMTRAQASAWRGFLAELRGRANVFQLGDPVCCIPRGVARGVPLVDGSVTTNNQPTSTTLFTKGWIVSVARQLLRGDYLQIGYRLYMVCEDASSDDDGNMQVQVFPSIREQPADATPIVLVNTQGLFRLQSNKRGWSSSVTELTRLSLTAMEAR